MSDLLPQRFIAIAAQRGAAFALRQGASSITFGELASRALALSSVLRTRICGGDRVALLMENSADYVVSCYGVWMAGGVVVGLNTALKPDDLLWQIRHCGAVAVISEPRRWRELCGILPEPLRKSSFITGAGDGEIQGLDAVEPLIDELSSGCLPNADTHAQIIYTSGTTGRPKGVLLTHGNLASNIAAIQSYLDIRVDDIAMCVLPFFYTYGNSVLHSHLTMGSALILENSLMYPQTVVRQMQDQHVTAFYGVPSTYYILLARAQLDKDALSSLRYCAQAGGAMDPERIERFCAALPTVDFIVMYGQTEASARLTWLPPGDRQRKQGSVGVAIPSVELSVRGEDGVEVVTGSTGEVCVRGPNIMRGYWQDIEATNQVLRSGWLHTGDLGYCDADGYLYLVGRSKEMIKSGAHRISPREIEEVIATVAGVEDVAVIGIDDELLGQTIKACVVGCEDESLRRQILRTCRERLPLYKLPKVVEFYREFPRTASGKIQKHLLA